MSSAKVPRGPCLNPRLDTVQAFRGGDGDNGTVVPTLPDLRWPRDSRSYQVEVTWDFSPEVISQPPILRLELSEFEPNGETLAEEWMGEDNAELQVLLLPALACRDTELATKAVGDFLVNCQLSLERTISTVSRDPLMKMTWTEVLRVREAHHNKTLSNAVRIYTATLMNTEYLMSVDANAFGRPDIPNPPFFFKERSGGLLPPQLTFQLQTIIAMTQSRLQLAVIKDLKRVIFAQNRRVHWRTVFLTVFVLFASIELVYKKQREFLKAKRGISQPYRDKVSSVTSYMMKEWEDAAENLISHYRFVMRGHLLFTQPAGRDHDNNLEAAKLDWQDSEFIRRIRTAIEGRQQELLESRASRLKNDRKGLWAICELFLPDDFEITK
ncbi:hypothetical protein LIA77_04712 [Sarocladium implicatum]|nr:hypothetical protein LIA77_04712 [Sarocladium implicatum]